MRQVHGTSWGNDRSVYSCQVPTSMPVTMGPFVRTQTQIVAATHSWSAGIP